MSSVLLGFPVFCVGFLPNGRLLVGGGGGATKAGVKNALVLLDTLTGDTLQEYLFSKQDDGCMSLAIHPKDKWVAVGVNAPEDHIKQGSNLNCRFLSLHSSSTSTMGNKGCTTIKVQKAIQTLSSLDPFHHQKLVVFNEDGSRLLVGTSEGRALLYSWPDLINQGLPIEPGNELMDGHFLPTVSQGRPVPKGLELPKNKFLIVTPRKLLVYSYSVSSKNRQDCDPVLDWKMENPSCLGLPCEFRAARFSLTPEGQPCIFAVCNAKSRKASFILQFFWVPPSPQNSQEKGKWELRRTIQASKKPITAFALSPDNELMGYGSADLSITVKLTSRNFKTLMSVPEAHGFPVTALAFSPSSESLASGSADGTCRIVSIPPPPSQDRPLSWVLLFLALLVALLAYLFAS